MDIKESMEILVAVELSFDAIVAAAADGKIKIGDVRHLIAPVKATIAAVRGREKVGAELKDVDAAELEELIAKGEVLAVKAVAAMEALSALSE